MKEVFLGIDIGSATVKVVGVNKDGQIVGESIYIRHDEFPTQTDALKYALDKYLKADNYQVLGAGTTGSGRELNRKLFGADLSRSEIFAHAVGINYLIKTNQVIVDEKPISKVGSVIEIGGQDSKVIVFDNQGVPSFFNMNSICAAGTGEFLKQLSDEAEISLEDFGRIALEAKHPVRIDATCTVFSRRDFRHLTQKGVPLSDRLMGISQALVNNYVRNVLQGQTLKSPVIFQGGVAFNPAVRQAFAEKLGVRIVVPPHNDVVGALGMAIIVRDSYLNEETPWQPAFKDDFMERSFSSQLKYCHGCQNACELTQPLEEVYGKVEILDTLGGRCDNSKNPNNLRDTPQRSSLTLDIVEKNIKSTPKVLKQRRKRDSEGLLFAGIDGGSRGTKYALIKSLGDTLEILEVGAIETGGDALKAILTVTEKLAKLVDGPLGGIGTTGSAGELAQHILSFSEENTSDYRSTELIAHYTWAASMLPEVRTIFDIGGNDSKIITIDQRGLDFAMNDKCAAGTGTFLESVARRFHIPITDYASLALSSRNPSRISGRCAVFGESDIVHKSRTGFATNDLLLGLAYSIARTYLSDVGKGKVIATPIVAQGGTFLNQAIQHAFRDILNLSEEELYIASDTRLVLGAGALGAAILAKEKYEEGYTPTFKGFNHVLNSTYVTETASCHYGICGRQCDNLLVLKENNQVIAGYKSIDCPFGYYDGLFSNNEAIKASSIG